MQCTLQVVCLSDDEQASRSNIAERCGLRQVRHSIVQAYSSFWATILPGVTIRRHSPGGNVQAQHVVQQNHMRYITAE